MPDFSHLHVHTQYSLLDGAASIEGLVQKAAKDKMKALAITDHGNMYGAFHFVNEATKANVKPIVGCEFYLVEDRFRKKFTVENKDKRYHQLLLAKNKTGYKNLSALCSLGYIDGLYRNFPRIDKTLIKQYHEGLIGTTCCIGAEIPQAILNEGEEKAEKLLQWWLDLFGEDFYVELQRHNLKDQDRVNEVLLRFAKKYQLKVICTNDSHYVDKEDFETHDILLCINTRVLKSMPKKFDEEENSGREKTRFGFPNDQFYFKTQAEMLQLFSDIPESLDNTNEIIDKVEWLNLANDILLPNYPVPEPFKSQNEYLHHLAFLGLKEKYHPATLEIERRLEFELRVLQDMNFSGYFLIVSDFIRAAKEMGTVVGPGRGSAAGSLVAYCLGITNIDPIRYNLLFERFLNPERKSMPDVDIDFDDLGRDKVIDYVVDKYGKDHVGKIITFSTLGGKSSVRDVARVLNLPLNEADSLAKLIPTRQNKSIPIEKILHQPLEGTEGLLAQNNTYTDLKSKITQIRKLYNASDHSPVKQVLDAASKLEGGIRNSGVHAAGILVSPTKMMDIVPVATTKNTDLLLSQFDGRFIENAGILKMDFLGLTNLSIIKDTLDLIEKTHPDKPRLDIDKIPLDDVATFQIFKTGKTNGIFQFESDGMKNYLPQLQPDRFEDLIAMNALYRPGPMQYIPQYIERKFGRQKIIYDLPEMEETLKETYGITVYQEQVMLLSQKLAGFSKGDADMLRKAMGKKQKSTLEEMKEKFLSGIQKNNLDISICKKIWKDWEEFASYAFNKSHSTCYALVAYQTAYLKANYTVEFMTALLNNQKGLDRITKFIKECNDFGIQVKRPNVNYSEKLFNVHSEKEIAYGLHFLKGMGDKEIETLIREREKNGTYSDVLDFFRRLSGKDMKKSGYEVLVKSGALDDLELSRSSYFAVSKKTGRELNFIETLIGYANEYRKTVKESSQQPLFGDEETYILDQPDIPKVPEWDLLQTLELEKECSGVYFSGHPLNLYAFEVNHLLKSSLSELDIMDKLNGKTDTSLSDNEGNSYVEGTEMENEMGGVSTHEISEEEKRNLMNKNFRLGGYVADATHRISKRNTKYCHFLLEDFESSYNFSLFTDKYEKFGGMANKGAFLYIEGRIVNFSNRDEWSFQINKILPLESIVDKFVKGLKICIELDSIEPMFIDRCMKLLNVRNTNNMTRNIAVEFEIHHQFEKQDSLIKDIYESGKVASIPFSKEFIDDIEANNLRFEILSE